MNTGSMKLAKETLGNAISLMNMIAKHHKHFNSERLPVSRSRFIIMYILSIVDVRTIVELHRLTGISESTLSVHMSKLAEDGYVYSERHRNGGDARKKYFYLTEEGILLVNHGIHMLISDIEASFNRLSEEKKVYLYRGVKKLHDCFDDISNALLNTNFACVDMDVELKKGMVLEDGSHE